MVPPQGVVQGRLPCGLGPTPYFGTYAALGNTVSRRSGFAVRVEGALFGHAAVVVELGGRTPAHLLLPLRRCFQ